MRARHRAPIFFARFVVVLLAAPLVARLTAAAPIATQLTTAQTQQLQREARLVVDLLQNQHYSGRLFREIENKDMIGRFLQELDPEAEVLNAAKVDYLHRRFDRTLKSVYLFRGDLQPAFEMFDVFVAEANARLDWVQQRLDRGFDFTLDENFTPPAESTPARDAAAADRQWELALKEWVLVEQMRGRSLDEATAEVKRRYREYARTIASFDALAVRERFFDAVIRSYDPHSGYFSSDSAREFALEMEKAVVGVGLDLKKQNGRCVVVGVQPGGSADLSSALAPGDILVSLAEGADGAWVALDGLRLREIVALLRGAAGASVRLAYLPGGEEPRTEVTLERTRIVLAAERAHGAVATLPAAAPDKKARQIGWIELPSFYTAGENASLTSGTRDVRELLEQMNPAELDGLVLDLRGNPGGALTEAAALSELFLPGGIMILSRGTDGKTKEHTIKSGVPFYQGPLVVLISSSSASASEIFAGAMKYHQRGIVVGAGPSFGKGTVQNYIELAKMQGSDRRDWGTLRLTVERFYLADGQPVQRRGVSPDITLPASAASEESRREADLPGALPEETVPAPVGLTPMALPPAQVTAALKTKLVAATATRVQELPEWRLLQQESELRTKLEGEKVRTLRQDARREQWDADQLKIDAQRRERRTLSAQSGFATRAFEIAAVQAAAEVSQNRLRTQVGEVAGDATHLAQNAFIFATTTGKWRKLRLDSINFREFMGDAAPLAGPLSTATGHDVAPDQVANFLRDASLLEHRAEKALLVLARKYLVATDAAPDAARAALASLLGQLPAVQPELRQERPTLDVPLRESLRLAADWADDLQTASPP